jgi:hypothetical protein
MSATNDDRPSKKRWWEGKSDLLDRQLVSLVKAWVERAKIGEHDVELSFVNGELATRLRSYRKSAVRWRAVQIATWLVTALLGVLVAVLGGPPRLGVGARSAQLARGSAPNTNAAISSSGSGHTMNELAASPRSAST